ncbi:hypothetical protein [Bradyrhizobium diversitatis]|uniref:Uncharacterized protein n=1 Tax=Bradyrhizobium diversitatis TaxID=2755406 RepID=A0ABS0PFW5_9BRAD|nr:hypothetical protein [Bradyrhizobium diversitatis]MBH5391877.1 hypothetical protein [Bradyrhizobium diversitatis]
MADPAGWPAIIGMVGGVVGLLGGLASFRDRFYKGRPVGSLTTQNSFGNNVVLVRIKNTTNYDVVITSATERKGVYFLADGPEIESIARGQLGKAAFRAFMLKPNDEKELRVQALYKDGIALEGLGKKYVEFWIHWRRGNALWLPQVPLLVCGDTQMIRRIAGVE